MYFLKLYSIRCSKQYFVTNNQQNLNGRDHNGNAKNYNWVVTNNKQNFNGGDHNGNEHNHNGVVTKNKQNLNGEAHNGNEKNHNGDEEKGQDLKVGLYHSFIIVGIDELIITKIWTLKACGNSNLIGWEVAVRWWYGCMSPMITK